MRRSLLTLAVLAAVACASSNVPKYGNRPSTVAQPEITIGLMSTPFFGSGYTAPMPLDVEIINHASVPLTVRRIRVESTGMAEYALYPVERLLKDDIPPGQSKVFNLNATAYTNIARLTPVEPLSMRATVDFETGDVRFHEIMFQQLRPR